MMCCHQYPDNGSNLAVQTQTQREQDDPWEKLEAIREQAIYGFTGETLENLTWGMSSQEMNSWWRKRILSILDRP